MGALSEILKRALGVIEGEAGAAKGAAEIVSRETTPGAGAGAAPGPEIPPAGGVQPPLATQVAPTPAGPTAAPGPGPLSTPAGGAAPTPAALAPAAPVAAPVAAIAPRGPSSLVSSTPPPSAPSVTGGLPATAPRQIDREATLQAQMRSTIGEVGDTAAEGAIGRFSEPGAFGTTGKIDGGFNMRRWETTDDVKAFVNGTVEQYGDAFNEYRRGVQTLPEMNARALATMMDTSVDDVLAMRALKGEDLMRGGYAMATLAEEVKVLAQKAASTRSDEDIAKVILAQKDYVTLSMHVRGLESETARALGSLRNVRRQTQMAEDTLRSVIEQNGGVAHNVQLANLLSSMTTPQQVGAAIAKAQKVTRSDMFWEVYYSVALLSRPTTWTTNLYSSFYAALQKPAEWWVAGVVGGIRRELLGGEGGARMGEAFSFISDTDVIRRSWGDAIEAFKTGVPSGQASKFDGRTSRDAVTAHNVRELPEVAWVTHHVPQLLQNGHWTQVAFDLLADYGIRGSKRFIMATDEFVKGLAYESSMRQQIKRAGIEQGLTGKDFDDWVLAASSYPEAAGLEGAKKIALDEALDVTFQTPLGPLGQKITSAVFDKPAGASGVANVLANVVQAPIRMTFPFLRTPMNLVKYASKRQPLAILLPAFWEAMKKGGAQADMAKAQLAIGTSLAFGLYAAASGGYISGKGPVDPELAKTWEDEGFQPYAFRVPADSLVGRGMGLDTDKTITFQRSDPFSFLAGLAGDIHDVEGYATPDEQNWLATALVAGVFRNIMSRSWMSSAQQFFDAVGGIGRGDISGVGSYLTRLASTPFVPGILEWAGKTVDDSELERRDVRSDIAQINKSERRTNPQAGYDRAWTDFTAMAEETINRIKARMPGMGSDLPARLNYWGVEQKGQSGQLLNTITFYDKNLKIDTAALERIGLHPTRWTSVPASALSGSKWDTFIDAVGVSGEFLRLGWAPGQHGANIMGVPLTAREQHDYIKAVNKLTPDAGMVTDQDGRIVVDYSGLTLKEAMTEMMKSDGYRAANDFKEMTGSKHKLIEQLQSRYRHDANEDFETGLGGADFVVFSLHPGLATRLQRAREMGMSPDEPNPERLRK